MRLLRWMLFWLWPLYWLVPFIALDDWFYFFIAVIGPVVSLLLGLVDSLVFIIKRPFERWDMVKMIHRYRYEWLKNGRFNPPQVGRGEEIAHE